MAYQTKFFFMKKLLHLLLLCCICSVAHAQQNVTVSNTTGNTVYYYIRFGNSSCVPPYNSGSKTVMYTLGPNSTSIAYDYTNVAILPNAPVVTCAWTIDGISFVDGCSAPPIVETTVGESVCGYGQINTQTSGCTKPLPSVTISWNNTNPMAIAVTVY